MSQWARIINGEFRLPGLKNNTVKTYITYAKMKPHKQQMYVLKDTRGYWKFKQESLERAMGRTRFVRRFRNAATETTEREDTVSVTILYLVMCLHAN